MFRGLMVVFLVLAACSNQQSYQTKNQQFLAWSGGADLQVQRGGELVTGGNWAGLPKAVTCVPKALEAAEAARAQAVASDVTFWTGLAGLVGGGTAIVVDAGDGSKLTYGGLAGLFGGMALMFVTRGLTEESRADAIDAVNIYNDFAPETPGCH